MVKITQKEAKYLREQNKGYNIHVISKTHKSRGKTYYLTEEPATLQILNDYRTKRHQTDLITIKKRKYANSKY